MIESALLVGPAPAGSAACLAARELALLGPRATAKRRDDFLRGRWIAKQLLVSGSARSADQVLVLPDADGVPQAFDESGAPLGVCLSISHTSGLALAVRSPSPLRVGGDIEQRITNPRLIAEHYFTEAEQSLCGQSAEAEYSSRATAIWALKEAMLKAIGQGLRFPTRAVQVQQVPALSGQWQRALVCDDRGFGPWTAWIRQYEQAAIAVAVRTDQALDEPSLVVLRA